MSMPPTSATSRYAIRVEVKTQAVPEQTDPQVPRYMFAYTVKITNTGSVAAQLISRHWHIQDADGHVSEVKGLGVVGKQPLLQASESFEYTSGCPLKTPNGSMKGSYFFVAEDGTRFEVEIGEFLLGTPRVLH
jgi:ApaG protein